LKPDAALAGFSTSLGTGSDGLALGGGLAYNTRGGGFGLALDYAYKSLGVLGATHFYGATIHW
ncbi:MAG: hypothetical protein OEW56_11485, partial [Gemmatimonadota bacterium]|nr:hypothetical protein [Gemmatimonadota bacterium]